MFNIGPAERDTLDTSGCRLVVDIGLRHLHYAIIDRSGNNFQAVGAYHVKGQLAMDWLEEAGKLPFLDRDFASVDVTYNLSESVLVPEELHRSSSNPVLLNMVHGDLRNGVHREDDTHVQGIKNIYRLPEAFHHQVDRLFPHARFNHLYTCLIRQLAGSGIPTGDHLHLFFYHHMFVALLIKRGRLQLVQTCPYDLPEDVSYQLLNICEQLGIESSLIPVSVSGSIDPASPLFVEVLKYFVEVSLGDDLGDHGFSPEFAGYPRHYFQTFSLLALCAS